MARRISANRTDKPSEFPAPAPITAKKLIAVEGKDEIKFFEALLKYLDVADCDLREVGGKDKFNKKLPELKKASGFDDIEKFVVIRDADNSANGAFDSIKKILKGEGFKVPGKKNSFAAGNPIVGIYILPGIAEEGFLEDLCLKLVGNHPAMKCVEDFEKCAKKLPRPPNNISKAKAQVYLAAMPELAWQVGLGALKGYWNFDSPYLKNLKDFLNKLK